MSGLGSVSPVATEGVYSARSGHNFAAMHHSARYDVLVAAMQGNACPIDQQGVAALNDDHVFVVIVSMG